MRKLINDGLNKWQRYRLKNLEEYRRRKREYAKTPAQREYRRKYSYQWYVSGGGESQGHKKKLPRWEVFQQQIIKSENGCWLWQGLKDIFGYGIFGAHARQYRAHRFSYTKLKGKIPKGRHLHHICKTPSCVNPEHLVPLTPLEHAKVTDRSNNGKQLAKAQRSKKYCPQGHPYKGTNLRVEKRSDGGVARRCKICDNEKAKRYMERKKGIIWQRKKKLLWLY